ncbi:trifunctional dihydropteroate synthetase [Coemansia sp. RSA 1646]|nr:trifunctional dihydropteroate synthetase [Coemansia sp. RSA 1646]
MPDKYIVRDLEVRSTTLADESSKERCSVLLNITVELYISTIHHTAENESESIRYSDICGRITYFANTDRNLPRLETFAAGIVRELFDGMPRILAVRALVQLPHAVPNAEYVSIDVSHTRKELFGNWQSPATIDSKCDDSSPANGHLQHAAAFCEEHDKMQTLIEGAAEKNRMIIKNLSLCTESGLHFWGRHYKQTVNIDLILYLERPTGFGVGTFQEMSAKSTRFAEVVEATVDLVENNTFQSVEDMATAISRTAVQQCGLPEITVRISKPRSVVSASGEAVEITRAAGDFPKTQYPHIVLGRESEASLDNPEVPLFDLRKPLQESDIQPRDMHTAYIGIKTNKGDRLGNIYRALHYIRNNLPESRYIESSFLYESPAARGSDGPSYLDAAVFIKTKLEPLALRDRLRHIESKIRHGVAPSNKGNTSVAISLQILLYGETEFEGGGLTVPPPHLHENRVELRILCDFACTQQHPRLATTVKKLYHRLITRNNFPDDIIQVTQLKAHRHSKRSSPHRECILQALNPRQQKRTLFMGMLDLQPENVDYFDFIYYMSEAFQRVQKLSEGGADIIGICGQPKHPNVAPTSAQEEIANIIPLIAHIRNERIETPISVETYYPEVAAAALDAGADIICDTTGGLADPDMLSLVAKRRCPYIIVHPQDDLYPVASDMNASSSPSNDIVCKTRHRLAERIRAALDHGIARWNIILDPGVGFAKDSVQDFEMLRRFSQFTAANIGIPSKTKSSSYVDLVRLLKIPAKKDFVVEDLATSLVNYPVLFGSSRKSFIDDVTENHTGSHSACGTAAAITAAIQGGASIVQVYDVAEMSDVVYFSDYIHRR